MAEPRLEYVEFELSTVVGHFAKVLQPKDGGKLILQDYFIDKGKVILKLIVIDDNQHNSNGAIHQKQSASNRTDTNPD